MASNTALIVGVTGIVGIPLAQQLIDKKWKVYGISRRNADYIPSGVKHIALDVTKREDCEEKLKELTDVTHVFFVVWVNCGPEKENCRVNKKLIVDVLESLPAKLKHVALQTGTKHYLGSYEVIPERFQNPNIEEELSVPFKESLPRLPSANFYYDQEDAVFEMAANRGFTWSVARPGLIIGFAAKTEFNAASNFAVYASICKHLNLPFTFPGGAKNYKRLIFWDASDADLIAEHLIWEATTKEAANQAFNVANGDLFSYRSLWQHFAEYFELKVEVGSDEPMNMVEFMKDKETVWDDIVKKHGLKEMKLSDLCKNLPAMSGFLSLGTSILSDMTKSRELGFNSYISTEKSFTRAFDYMRKNKYIP